VPELRVLIDETHKPAMLAAGRWVKHNPASRAPASTSPACSRRGCDGARSREVARREEGRAEQLKTFFNTLLGLLYVGIGEEMDPTKLTDRRVSAA
jgi:hypothetical protein